MNDALITAVGAVAAAALVCFSALRAWRGWLELKHAELTRQALAEPPADDDVGVRIELAAVRERLKKLEAIASGVDP